MWQEGSFNDVTNLVLTINQFISIIAGAPGVGKTLGRKIIKS
jgi:hypothetical protein